MLTSTLERYIRCEVLAHGCPNVVSCERFDPEIAPQIREVWDRVVRNLGTHKCVKCNTNPDARLCVCTLAGLKDGESRQL